MKPLVVTEEHIKGHHGRESTNSTLRSPYWKTHLFVFSTDYKEKRVRKYYDNKLYPYLMPLYFVPYIFVQFLKPLDTHASHVHM